MPHIKAHLYGTVNKIENGLDCAVKNRHYPIEEEEFKKEIEPAIVAWRDLSAIYGEMVYHP